ncbi:hypothetical protein GCM10010293_56860 [Streptomyces griseoflavus]|nr:hypothetical protein GCM10010293_56860 [Streptomyces griseoflavus]
MKPRGDGGAADGKNAGAAGELRRHCPSHLEPLRSVRVPRFSALRGQSCRWGGTGGRDGTPLAQGCAHTPPARPHARHLTTTGIRNPVPPNRTSPAPATPRTLTPCPRTSSPR